MCFFQALIHGLNRHYYSIAINYRKNELEEKMLLNLHKKKWTDGLILKRFDTHSKTNEQTVQVCTASSISCMDYGDNFSSVGASYLIIYFLVAYYPQCLFSCTGNAEPSHQVQQGSARGGWAATWETCHSECGAAGCKEAFGRACVKFDVIKHSSDPRNHAWHGCLLAYSYCCSKQSTHTHFIEAPDTWMSLTPDTFWFYCLFMNALFCSMLLLNFLLFFSIKALGYSNYV